MHYRFLVTFNKEEADTSQEARQYVFDFLNEEGFVESGRWNQGLADWFVIGGRWSGELSRLSWGKDLYERMNKVEEAEGVRVWGVFYADPEKTKRQKEVEAMLEEMWKAEAPEQYKGIPVNRDCYRQLGYEDDAMIVTDELYEALLKDYERLADSEQYADFEWEECARDIVGKKWVVVVDYHN